MTLYKITYKTTEGTYDAHITEQSEAAARKAFKKRYDGEIVAVEFVRDNVSATKEQERKAVEQIRAILATLGPDSYTATALDGCLEIAEQNIEFDFADSMKGRLEVAEAEVAKLREKLASSVKDYEAAHEAAHQVADDKDAEIARLQAQVESLTAKKAELLESLAAAHDESIKNWNNFRAQEDRADAAEQQVVTLKAKLYDYMTAGAQ